LRWWTVTANCRVGALCAAADGGGPTFKQKDVSARTIVRTLRMIRIGGCRHRPLGTADAACPAPDRACDEQLGGRILFV
jgi:hypothetical protein